MEKLHRNRMGFVGHTVMLDGTVIRVGDTTSDSSAKGNVSSDSSSILKAKIDLDQIHARIFNNIIRWSHL